MIFGELSLQGTWQHGDWKESQSMTSEWFCNLCTAPFAFVMLFVMQSMISGAILWRLCSVMLVLFHYYYGTAKKVFGKCLPYISNLH